MNTSVIVGLSIASYKRKEEALNRDRNRHDWGEKGSASSKS
jgi:hypothetical protein